MNAAVLPEIVLVEDRAVDETMWMKGMLSSRVPCHVTVRRGEAEALDHLLDVSEPAPTLIILDHRLPKLNALEMLSCLRHNDKTRYVPVVVFVGSDAEKDVTDCYRGGANSCVTKPGLRRGFIERLTRIARYWLTVDGAGRDEMRRLKAASRNKHG
jgi:two-component system response regulator